jgi:hypothetical protein
MEDGVWRAMVGNPSCDIEHQRRHWRYRKDVYEERASEQGGHLRWCWLTLSLWEARDRDRYIERSHRSFYTRHTRWKFIKEIIRS